MACPAKEEPALESWGRRCVLVVGVDASVPSSLLEQLQDRGAVAVVVVSAAAAMTALAEAPTHALIVQDPDCFACFDDLLTAVSVYHAGVVIWAYEPGLVNGSSGNSMGRLYRVRRPSFLDATQGKRQAAMPPSPAQQVTGGGDEPERAEDGAVVTPEELLMLLGPVHRSSRDDAHEDHQ